MLTINQSKNHSFPKTKQAWANYINDCHDNGLNDREALEMQWARNIAYYHGFQHLIFDPALKLLQIDPGQDESYIINRIAPFVEQRVAKLTRSKPTIAILPDKIDPMTVKGAEISENLSKHLWKVNDKDEKLENACLKAVLMGSSFFKTIWNSEGGEPILEDQDEEGNVMFNEETGQREMNKIFLGDVESHVRSSFDIIVSRGAKDLKSAEWLIDRTPRCILEIKEKFKNFDDTKTTRREDDLTRFEQFVNNLGCPFVGSYGSSKIIGNDALGNRDQELVVVKEFWMKPNMVYPDGVMATVVGDELLQFEAWDYDHKDYPYSKIDATRNPFGFYGLSPVTRLIPIQQHYNEARTQIAKNARLMANVKWWVPKGSGLAEDALTDEEGEVVETNGNMSPPQQIQSAPLPNYVIENQNQDILDIRDVGGEREATQMPFPGLTAGVALETAAELSDIGLGPTMKNIERALVRSARQELILANQFYLDERIIKVAGTTQGEIKVIALKNTDLMNQTDVTIQLESSLGYARAAARQNLIDMWDRRIITDPEAFMKAYATGNIDIILRAKDPAEAVVIADVEEIKQGKNPVVSPFDNHIVYIKMLSNFIQTPEFRKMPPDRQQLAAQTLQQHLAFLQPQQPTAEQNPAAVNTPFGSQVPEGMNPNQGPAA